MSVHMPRVVITGLAGGSGKTTVAVGLTRALARRGLKVQTFKKGPDYIDTLFLSMASGLKPRNLDPYMLDAGYLPHLFEVACQDNAIKPDLAIIEGNRGLFDGQDVDGSCSTAELSRRLKAPVILVVNCTKVTRTVAALVLGCKNFEPETNLAGVVLNQLGRERHKAIVSESVEKYTDIPVLGAMLRAKTPLLDERQSGLIGDDALFSEQNFLERLDALADFVEAHIDVDAIIEIARKAPPLEVTKQIPFPPVQTAVPAELGRRPRIGYIRDAAFWFYYTDNLDALRRAGAELVELSLLSQGDWPSVDGIYMGAGYPEDYAHSIAANDAAKKRISMAVQAGMPIYAEGSALYFLSASLTAGGQSYAMCGTFPVDAVFAKHPQSLGYTLAEVTAENPFHPVGTELKGHEFHYAQTAVKGDLPKTVLEVKKGLSLQKDGKLSGQSGLLVNNCMATHMQIFAPGVLHWAPNFVKAALNYALHKKDKV